MDDKRIRFAPHASAPPIKLEVIIPQAWGGSEGTDVVMPSPGLWNTTITTI